MHSEDESTSRITKDHIVLVGGPYPHPPDQEKLTLRVDLLNNVIDSMGWGDDIETDMALQIVRASLGQSVELQQMDVVSSGLVGKTPEEALRARIKDHSHGDTSD